MDLYLWYITLAMITIAMPGPGVILTIHNAAQRGLARSIAGIIGISLGVMLVAAISATSLGIILTNSAIAFTTVKYAGALYLVYMGVKMWKSDNKVEMSSRTASASCLKCFYEGILLSLSNPKSIIFFMSVFPHFIDQSKEYTHQFALLALTFGMLILAIHMTYALITVLLKARIRQYARKFPMNKISGGILVGFGIGLAATK